MRGTQGSLLYAIFTQRDEFLISIVNNLLFLYPISMTCFCSCALIVRCSDVPTPSLGRVNIDDLPQQALMELFIAGFGEAETICGNRETPTDIEKWSGVWLNAAGEVEGLNWSWILETCEGSLPLHFLPSSVRKCDLSMNALAGPLDVTTLPVGLEELILSSNEFDGSVNLVCLPKRLRVLRLSSNHLTGQLHLDELPDTLEDLSLSDNDFSGTVNLTRLPRSLMELSLAGNDLSGSVFLTALPGLMTSLNLCDNHFQGSLDLTALPGSLQNVWLDRNMFSGTIVVAVMRGREISLSGNLPMQVVDQNLRAITHFDISV